MGRRLKIAMISPGTFPISGGKSSSIEMLMKKLANLFQKEAYVFMFGKGFRKQPEWETKGSITYYRYTSSKAKTYINQSIDQLKVIKPDIIHIENRPRFAKAVRLAIPNAKISLYLGKLVKYEKF
ncbi:hypothetical protein P5G62_024570 [Neobacillus sp. 179-C4.2 HS]|uniref:Glycosyltransferase family 1 protein n=1 Tax=Neobacillus driksii TaxID=3035913 RepID=A0ABV4YZW8_9BACI|nr:hypothetical protein [Neobacillus sp. 179.-C4.2 HS]MDP5196831.1 hypothetical protein [Neobacillus sp. 179.-C4.2 HS]